MRKPHRNPRLAAPLALLLASGLAWAAGSTPAAARDPEGPARPARPAAVTVLDDFEDPAWPDPRLWQLPTERPAGQVPAWWPSTCQRRSGARALWAFGGRVGAIEQPCGAGAPLGSSSRIVLSLDLRQAQAASRLELLFDVWMRLPAGPGNGLFLYYLRPEADGRVTRAPVFAATGDSGTWTFPERLLDLMNLADLAEPQRVYDLRGQVARLEWLAQAPQGTDPGAGLYIDRLRLVWEPDPALAPPTARPTAPAATVTASPSATPAASATPSPSATPLASATATRSGITLPTFTPSATRRPRGLIWLPWLELAAPPTREPS